MSSPGDNDRTPSAGIEPAPGAELAEGDLTPQPDAPSGDAPQPNRPATVLCIVGSPRRRGNSEQLLDAAMRGARSAGADPVKLVAGEAGARACMGCNACSLTGECVIKTDGMRDVYEAIDAADAVIVASPVYFAAPPAVLKLILDRFQPYWARRYVLKEPPRDAKRPGALLIAAAGGANPFGAGCVIKPLRSALAVVDVEVLDVLEVFGVDSPSDVGRHADALERAAEMGAQVARSAVERRAQR